LEGVLKLQGVKLDLSVFTVIVLLHITIWILSYPKYYDVW